MYSINGCPFHRRFFPPFVVVGVLTKRGPLEEVRFLNGAPVKQVQHNAFAIKRISIFLIIFTHS
jgi:hypothetical protein